MLTIQAKNTMFHLNGQNFRLQAKNGRTLKTPGHHLSLTHGKEAVGHRVACSSTQEGTAQLDLLLKPPRPHLEREVESQQVRRPLTLAPLELPEDIREAQRRKLQFIQQEAKPTSFKPDVTVNETPTRKVKSCARQRLVKAAVCPPVSPEPLKAQNRSSRPQLTRTNPMEQKGDGHLDDVVCRGTPAPLHNKPGPLLSSARVKAQAACGTEEGNQNTSTLLQETGRRRLRLRRAQCLEEDQHNSNTSTGGLSAEKGKLAQGVQGKGQQAGDRGGQPHAGNGVKQPPAASWEYRRVRKSYQEDCNQQSARCTLNGQSDEGENSGHTLYGVKPSASNIRLKNKKPFMTNHSNAVPL